MVCAQSEGDSVGGYREIFQTSLGDPAAFWAQAAKALSWTREPGRILDDDNPPFYRWFPDAELNTCFNAGPPHRARATSRR